jgi:hypothetical protein
VQAARRTRGCAAIGVVAALLAACGPAVAPALDPSAATVSHSKSQPLLYVSDGAFGNVYIFAYHEAKLVGELTHLDTPAGVCHDGAGDVYVVIAGDAAIYEYAHGGSQPIEMLSDPSGTPLGCSIDSLTGDLAVVNQTGPSSGAPPNVVVFQNARGKPVTYSDKNVAALYFCAYDDVGNLFVDGKSSASGSGVLAELRRGRPPFSNIALDKSVNPTGGVQWDGKFLDVGDREGSAGHADVYRLSIGAGRGKNVYTTPLGGDNDIVSFWIAGRTVVGGDLVAGSVMYWSYPRGGNSTKNLLGFSDPVALTVSIAK